MCLQVGMRINYVYRSAPKQIENKLSLTEERFLNHWYFQCIDKLCQSYYDFYAQNQEMAIAVLARSEHPKILPHEELKFHQDIDEFSLQQMSGLILQFEADLDPKDFQKLLKHNFPRLKVFFDALWLDNYPQFMEAFISYGPKWIADENNQSSRLIVDLVKNCVVALDSYESTFDSPWASSQDIEIEHETLFKVSQVKLGLTYKKWEASKMGLISGFDLSF